ncbi:hypothetical protein [Sphingomonas sp. Marseille-Q8236]
MSRLVIVQPLLVSAAASTRGTGADNLRSANPKEVWMDGATGGDVSITIDLGVGATIDTICLGYIRGSVAGTTWSITGGMVSADQVAIQAATSLRVPDAADSFEPVSHGLWSGAALTIRYLKITLSHPGPDRLSAGVLVVGKAFRPVLGQDWGGGRQPIDTGTATPLPDGGFATVEGVIKSGFSCTLSDLSEAETLQLERIAKALGTVRPGLLIEDDTRSAGLITRMHYGLFGKWKPFERRNRAQTRWDISIEQWV